MRGVATALFMFGVATAPLAGQSAESYLVGDVFLAIRVADLDAASEWYARVFDLTEVNRLAGDGFAIRILAGQQMSVELIHQDGVAPPEGRSTGLFKAGIFVRDIGGFRERLLEWGVDTDDTIFVDEALQMRSFVMRDIEGNRLQAFERCAVACARAPDR